MSNLPSLQTNKLNILLSKGFVSDKQVEVYTLTMTRGAKPTIKELVTLLQFLVKDVGAKTVESFDLMRIAQFVEKRYAEFSIQELKTAFEYQLTGELDVDDEKPIEHFGNFSVAYVSKVLNAYRVKRKESNKIVQLQLPVPEVVLSKEQIEEIHNNFLITFDKIYSEFLNGKEISHRVSWIYYEWLDTRKLVTLTRKQKEKILFLARKKVNEERQQLQILIRLNRESGNPEDKVKSLAKALAVIEQFKKYERNGVSRISELVRKEKTTQV